MSADEVALAQLRQFTAQAAMDVQSLMALSQRLAACGQQSSIGSEADISVMSWDWNLSAPAPAAGSSATDNAIRAANMVRAKAMSGWRIIPRSRYGQVTFLRGARWQN